MLAELKKYKWVWLLILAFLLGQGASLLQAQVGVSPGRYRFGATIAPSTNDGAAVGTTALGWSDLHLATGAVINWANGEVTLTETDANTLTLAGGVLVLPAGAVSAQALQISDAGGFYAIDTDVLGFSTPSLGLRFRFDNSQLGLKADGITIIFGAGDDLILGRDAAATLQLGNDSATPIAQTLKGPDARAGTDTDTAGGNITIAAGRGTGTGNPGNIYLQTGATNTSGTGAGPLTTRLQIASSGVTIIASHTRFNVASSTTGSGSALLGTNAPVGQVSAPYVWIAVIASDGTAAWIPAWR